MKSQLTGFTLAICLIGTGCSGDAARQAHYDAGLRHLAADRPAEAIIEFRNAVQIDERWGPARSKLAEAFEANGESERAYREYIRAADLQPDDDAAQLRAARFLLVAGQYEDARSRADQVLARNPRNIDALIARGNALAGLRDLDGALTTIEEAAKLEPGRGQIYSSLALIRVAQGQRDQARTAFEKAVETDPKSVTAHLALANFCWSLGEMDASEQSLKRALAIDQANLLTNRALATFYVATARPAEAEAHLKLIAAASKTPDAQFALAEYYATNARPDDARKVLQPLTGQPNTATGAGMRLADLAYRSGEKLTAHASLDAILAREPNDALARLTKANWLLQEGRARGALQQATQAVQLNPGLIAAYYTRGIAEVRLRRSQDAIKSFMDVLRLNPRAVDAQIQLSALHLERRSIESAVLFAEEALSATPDSVDGQLAIIRAWMARGDLALARSGMARLKKQAPANAAVHALDGVLLARNKETAAARQAFTRALELDPSSFDALVGLTRLDVQTGRPGQALPLVEDRLAKTPDDARLLLLSATLLVAEGKLQPAEQRLRRALSNDPLDVNAAGLLARVYATSKRGAEARRELDETARRDPDDMSAAIMAAVMAHAQGDLPDAIRRYEEVLKREPRAVIAANNLAAIYADAGENLDMAQRLAEMAADQLPSNADIQDTLGWVYYSRQLHPQAITRFLQSISIQPDNAVYHYHLGLAYAKNGEPERARQALQRALGLNPRYTVAREELASLGQ